MPPIYVMVKPVSGACNLRCTYCFYTDEMSRRETPLFGKMSPETLETLVKKVFTEAEGEAGFAFQGGEPMLAGLDFYRRLMELEERYNLRNIPVHNSIQTNGVLMNDEWAAFFHDHGFLVGLSMDGDRALHDGCRLDEKGKGTHDAVLRAARIMQKHKTDFNILCTVTNFVARHGDSVYRFFKQNGFRYLQFTPCLDEFDAAKPSVYALTSKRYGQFLKTVFDRYFEDFTRDDYVSIRLFDNMVRMVRGEMPEQCGMLGRCSANFILEADGSVYPCDFYMFETYCMGNIKDHTFAQLRESEAAKRFVEESLPVREECKTCRYGSLCRGSCRRYREPFTKGLPGAFIFCEAYKEFFAYAADRLVAIGRSIR